METQKNFKNPFENVISPYLESVGNLDLKMKDILLSNIDDNEKVKLYSNVLKKYLIHRYKYLDPKENIDKSLDFEYLNILPVKITTKQHLNLKKKKLTKNINPKIIPSKSKTSPLKKTNLQSKPVENITSQPLTSNKTPIKRKGIANLKAKSKIQNFSAAFSPL